MAKAKPRPLAPDVVDLLKTQHRQIKRGFLAAMLPGPRQRERFEALRKLLAVHEAAEEAHVHPMLKKLAKDGRALARRRLLEEAAAKKLLKEIDETGPGHRGFLPKLWALQLAVLRHARQEETEEFPLLRRGLSPLRRRLLGAESLITQMIAPTRPHPLVTHQVPNKLAAPVVSPVDRGRDLVRSLRG